MANSNRLYTNDSGQIFIPMNVDGGSGNASFWGTGKTVLSIVLGFLNFVAIPNILDGGGFLYKVVVILCLIGVDILIIRKFIIEEKYYLKMYAKQQEFEVAEPSIFWNVNINSGNILYYLDGKMGVLVKLERDTIVGKDIDFEEQHYDAWSEFYRELNNQGLKRVQMNLMSSSGDDPRFASLDKLSVGAKYNENLQELVEKQVGHIKNRARNTLFEDDYFLFYTDSYIPHEELLQKAHLSLAKLMKGAFIGYKVLSRAQINELFKSEFNIKYFSEDDVSLSIYGNINRSIQALHIKKLKVAGNTYDITKEQEKKLEQLVKELHTGKKEYGEQSLIDVLKIDIPSADNNTDISNLEGVTDDEQEYDLEDDDIVFEFDDEDDDDFDIIM